MWWRTQIMQCSRSIRAIINEKPSWHQWEKANDDSIMSNKMKVNYRRWRRNYSDRCLSTTSGTENSSWVKFRRTREGRNSWLMIEMDDLVNRLKDQQWLNWKLDWTHTEKIFLKAFKKLILLLYLYELKRIYSKVFFHRFKWEKKFCFFFTGRNALEIVAVLADPPARKTLRKK